MNRAMCAAFFPSSFEEEGCAEGAGWWSAHKTTPPAAQAPLHHPARFAGTPPQDEEGMGGETEFGKCS